MGCRPALVEWRRGIIWSFLSRCGAVACGGSKSPSFKSDGSGDDVLHTTELLLRGWGVGPVMDRKDLGQHRLGCPRKEELAGAPNIRGGYRCLEGGRHDDVEYPAPA